MDLYNKDRVYVSLLGPFLGYYAKVPGARNDLEARVMCNTDRRMKSLWCSTYTLEDVRRMISEYGGELITIKSLDYDVHEINKIRAEEANAKAVDNSPSDQ